MASPVAFAAWLSQAMRQADLDIDSQQGGGRAALAKACGVSRSTVGRWLSGGVIPDPEYYKPIAEALGVRITDLLIGAEILQPEDLPEATVSTPSKPMTALELGRHWDIPEDKMEIFIRMFETLTRTLADEPAPPARRVAKVRPPKPAA